MSTRREHKLFIIFQGMQQIKAVMTKTQRHEKTNCFFLATICHGMEQGWLLDTNRRRAFRLGELTTDLCAVPTLEGKPKVLLIEEYVGSKYSHLVGMQSNTSCDLLWCLPDWDNFTSVNPGTSIVTSISKTYYQQVHTRLSTSKKMICY